MDNKELLKEIGYELPVDNTGSGFVDPRTKGMVFFSQAQLKQIGVLLVKKAQTMTQEEIEREVLSAR